MQKSLTFFGWLAGGLLLGGSAWAAMTSYVALPGMSAPEHPYASWETAATNIQTALAAVQTNEGASAVIVTAGVHSLTAVVGIYTSVTIRSWSDGEIDPINTIFDAGGSSARFNLSHSNAILDGFTLRNGTNCGVNISYGTVRNCLIISNSGVNGGGVIMTGGRVENCLIRTNISTSGAGGGGGGVYMHAGTVSQSRITGNVCTNAVGGGFYIATTGLVENCAIDNNTAKATGGIYLLYDGSVVGCAIRSNLNSGSGGSGGGIYLEYGAKANGGVLVDRCLITHNVATNMAYGGGLYIKTPSRGTVRNCLFMYNHSYYFGGGVAMYGTNGVLENCTIVSNIAGIPGGYGPNGGGVLMANGGIATNCIVRYNLIVSAAGVTNTGDYRLLSTPTGRFDNCCTYPLPPVGANNITNDPVFAAPDADNLRLAANSPCINAGTNQAWMAGAHDLDRRQRIDLFSGRVDMGCYEYINSGTMFGLH